MRATAYVYQFPGLGKWNLGGQFLPLKIHSYRGPGLTFGARPNPENFEHLMKEFQEGAARLPASAGVITVGGRPVSRAKESAALLAT